MLEYIFLPKESYLQNLNLSKFVSTMALHYLCIKIEKVGNRKTSSLDFHTETHPVFYK